MKIISNLTKIIPMIALVLTFSSCNNDDDNNVPPQQELSIVETAIATPSLTSLVAALQAADGNLVNVLNGDGPFTVLAPTNEAFATFLSANGFSNLSEVPTNLLSQILLNHVISGNVSSSNLTSFGSGYTTTSASGAGNNPMSIYFNTSNGVKFNGVSSVSTADIMASNGTIHIVDAVIGLPTVVTFATANPGLSNLVAALQSADTQNPSPNLIPTLSGNGPFTVFAPTDTAFAALLVELDPSGNTGLGDVPPATVQNILLTHVVSGNVRSTDLTTGPVTTLNGIINLNASNLTLTDPNERVSNIIPTLIDIQAVNGVVHVIDKVLLPQQ